MVLEKYSPLSVAFLHFTFSTSHDKVSIDAEIFHFFIGKGEGKEEKRG
jgi:hypothetical protein